MSSSEELNAGISHLFYYFKVEVSSLTDRLRNFTSKWFRTSSTQNSRYSFTNL